MALLSVSELFSDPDFVDPVTIYRKTQTINEYGEGVYTEVKIETVASVQWGGVVFNKHERGTHFDRDIVFYCRIPLYAMDSGSYCDEIEFSGRRYMVTEVTETAENFGGGFTVAKATLID